jgi:hypothetical protein
MAGMRSTQVIRVADGKILRHFRIAPQRAMLSATGAANKKDYYANAALQ